jgi:hypothetical protein
MNDVIAQLQQQVHANASGGFEQVNCPLSFLSFLNKRKNIDIFWQFYKASVTPVR